MNITRLNFLESLPLVKSAISKSHFLAFDLEMSGIMTEQLTSPSIIDSIQKRYEKQKQSIGKFIPLQFGLSAFEVQPSLNRIIAHPFNFYIFPLTQPFQTMKFSFHAGTMNFLVKNRFDFNKLFYEGIPYTSKEKLKIYEKQENINQFRSQLKKLKQVESPEVRAFVKMNFPIVEQWIVSENSTLQISIAFIKYQSYMLLKDKIQSSFETVPLIFEFDNAQIYKRTKMTIRKCTLEQKMQVNSNTSQAPESQALFNEVFDEMIQSKKPLILHNGFLDLMHVYLQFMESLPDSYADYRSKVNALFPYLYDNKYLFSSSPTLNHQTQLKLTGLEHCFTAMRQIAKREDSLSASALKIEISDELKEYNLDSLECHEAGFDSLMTGYSFLKGVTHLNPNLQLLTNPRDFHKEHDLIRNRIPQGSIKVPFNFQSNQQDIYIKDGNAPLFFQSILNQKAEQHKIMQYFSRNYGSVNMLWTARNMTEFCILFINQQTKQKFLRNLKRDGSNIPLCKIENIDFLVLSDREHQRKMNNLISLEKQQQQ